MPTFFENQTSDTEVEINWNGNNNPGTIQLVGTWDGATITITGSLNDGGDYSSPLNNTFTTDTIEPFEMAVGKVKCALSGAGASTDLSAYLSPG